jgi:plasmid maintenance system antidote protein VapI
MDFLRCCFAWPSCCPFELLNTTHQIGEELSTMNQIAIPIEVTPQEVSREASLGGAISLCAKAAGLTPKEVQDALKADRSQFSRWTDDKEGITWSKLAALMDACGNDAPLFWMLNARGFDLYSLRRQETVTERELRVERELRIKAEERVKYFEEVMTGRRAAA